MLYFIPWTLIQQSEKTRINKTKLRLYNENQIMQISIPVPCDSVVAFSLVSL